MRYPRVLWPLALMALSACGGSASTPAPAATVDTSKLTYSALVLDGRAITVTPDPSAFTFSNFSSGPVVKITAPKDQGVESVTYAAVDATHGGLKFTFAAPQTLGLGQYVTPVSIAVCLDTACMQQVQSFTISVTYSVTERFSTTGSNAYTISALPVPQTHSVAGVPQQTSLVLGIAADAATHASSVGVLDPASGTVRYSAQAVGDNVSIADDGATVYAWPTALSPATAAITQLTLDTLGAGAPLVLTAAVRAVHPAPGAPATIAVEYSNLVQVFDSSVPRPNSVTDPVQLLVSQWLTPSALVVLHDNPGTPDWHYVCVEPVDANGLGASPPCNAPTTLGATAVSTAGNLIFVSSGEVVSTSELKAAGAIALPSAGRIVGAPLPDAALGRLFVVEEQTGGGCQLVSYALPALTQIAILDLPADAMGFCLGNQNGVVRFGADGLAFNAGSDIITITGAFVTG
jgi:hypothetical protein